jgi:hypothetical protein
MSQLGPPAGAIVTAAAAGLPGLLSAVRSRVGALVPALPRPDEEEGDLGDLLVARPAGEAVQVLPPDALAKAAHALAVRIHRGDAPPAHLDAITLPAPAELRPDSGPARLTFRGQEHFLSGSPFIMGRDPACDLVFESELYPHVSARHCEIVFDRRAYTLCDRSRHGTFINDRPVSQQALHSGDWIRLGPQGPLVRFLGQPDPAPTGGWR